MVDTGVNSTRNGHDEDGSADYTNSIMSRSLSQDVLEELLTTAGGSTERLNRSEDNRMELKKSFSAESLLDYAKTMAAFANAGGGYLIFGVLDKPRQIVGLANDNFDKTDPAKLTTCLNNHFSPEIRWEKMVHQHNGNRIGIIYTEESLCKPVVALKNDGSGESSVKEGEIYYRYNGKTDRIRYSELRGILDKVRDDETNRWMNLISRVAKVGVANVGLLDLKTGLLTGSGGQLLVDKSVLPNVRFIKEGHFSEVEGDPALMLTGEVVPIDSELIQPVKTIVVNEGITLSDIVDCFLNNKTIPNPKDYITQMCHQSTGNLPIYHYIRMADMTIEETIRFVSGIKSRTKKGRIIRNRLKNSLDSGYGKGFVYSREDYVKMIVGKQLDRMIGPEEIVIFLRSVRTIEQKKIDRAYLYPYLWDAFGHYYFNADGRTAQEFRKTLCHLDYHQNRPYIRKDTIPTK